MTRKRLLVLEDDANSRVALQEILEDEGYEVATAPSGRGLDAMLERFEPNLVITDLYMPGGDGAEVTKRLKAHRKRIPVLLLTAHDLDAPAVGADRALRKPVDLGLFLGVVSALLM